MSGACRRFKRYHLQKPTEGAACPRHPAGRQIIDDPPAEFARLLILAFASEKEIRAQQAFIRGVISAGNHGAVRREWNELTNLLSENKALSRRLRAVFDQ